MALLGCTGIIENFLWRGLQVQLLLFVSEIFDVSVLRLSPRILGRQVGCHPELHQKRCTCAGLNLPHENGERCLHGTPMCGKSEGLQHIEKMKWRKMEEEKGG